MPHLAAYCNDLSATDTNCCSVLELRQYTLHPGERDNLIRLFEAEFIEPQEALGMHVVGTFVDLDDPDRFVWIRGFPSHKVRTEALAGFYHGPVWAAKRAEANRTMVDTENVLMLRLAPGHASIPQLPARSDVLAADQAAGHTPPHRAGGSGAANISAGPSSGLFHIQIFELSDPDQESDVLDLLAHRRIPVAAATGARPVAVLRTDPTEAGFPPLPVRRDVHAVVVIDCHHSLSAFQRYLEDPARNVLLKQLYRYCAAIQTLRLAPTARSEMR